MALVTHSGDADDGRTRYSLQNPATLEPIGQFTAANAEDARTAVARARAAQAAWEALGFKQRAEYLTRLKLVMESSRTTCNKLDMPFSPYRGNLLYLYTIKSTIFGHRESRLSAVCYLSALKWKVLL